LREKINEILQSLSCDILLDVRLSFAAGALQTSGQGRNASTQIESPRCAARWFPTIANEHNA